MNFYNKCTKISAKKTLQFPVPKSFNKTGSVCMEKIVYFCSFNQIGQVI